MRTTDSRVHELAPWGDGMWAPLQGAARHESTRGLHAGLRTEHAFTDWFVWPWLDAAEIDAVELGDEVTAALYGHRADETRLHTIALADRFGL